MMHLSGITSNAGSARHMTGIAGKSSKTPSNVVMFNAGKKGEEEDNAVTRLQDQINSLRERVQSIAENDSLDAKTKAELTRNVKEQMGELTQQLNQRRLELRQQELEEEEEAQSKGKAPDSDQASKDTGKSRYDNFTKDDGLGGISNAMMSASNSVKLSRLQQGIAARKEGEIGILEKQIQKDTKLIGRTVPAGLQEIPPSEKQDGAQAAESEAPADKISLTKSKAEANITESSFSLTEAAKEADKAVKSHFPKDETRYTLRFEKIWEVSRGVAVEAKDKEIAELRSDIHKIEKKQAENIGDANRALSEKEENAREDSDGFADSVEKKAAVSVTYNKSGTVKAVFAGLSKADGETSLDVYA